MFNYFSDNIYIQMASGTKEMITETTKIKTKFPVIPGTKPSIRNAQLLISTGILSLDNIIGLCTCAILFFVFFTK